MAKAPYSCFRLYFRCPDPKHNPLRELTREGSIGPGGHRGLGLCDKRTLSSLADRLRDTSNGGNRKQDT